MTARSPRTMRDIGRGAVFVVAGRGTEIVLALATQVLIARAVGAAGFGVVAQCLAVLYVLAVLCVFGFAETASRFVPVYLAQADPARIRRILHLGLAAAIGVGALSAVTVAALARAGLVFTATPAIRTILPIFAASLPWLATTQFIHGVFRGFGRAALKLTTYDLPIGALRVVAVAAAVALGWGVTGIAWGYTLTFCAGALLSLWVLHRHVWSLTDGGNGPIMGTQQEELSGFLIGLLLLDLVWIGMEHMDVLCLAWFRPATEVGWYRAGNQLARPLGLLVSAIAYLYVPAIAHHWAGGATERIRALYRRAVRWISWAGLPAAAILMCWSPWAARCLYGEAFVRSADITRILLIGYLAHCLTGPNGSTLIVLGRITFSVQAAALVLGVNLALNVLLIPTWGMYGAALASTAALVLLSVLNQAGLHRFLGLPGQQLTYLWQMAGVLLVIGAGLLWRVH